MYEAKRNIFIDLLATSDLIFFVMDAPPMGIPEKSSTVNLNPFKNVITVGKDLGSILL